MLTSITPLGERGRHNRWAVAVVSHAVGGLLGGITTGAALGWIGSPLVVRLGDSGVLWALVVVVVFALSLEQAGVKPPGLRRQVNEDWLDEYRSWVYGFGFGYQLGAGWLTIVTSAITWCVMAGAVLAGSAIGGAVVMGTYGLVRGLSVVAAAGVRDRSALFSLARRLERWSAPVDRLATLVMAAVAAISVTRLLV